MKSQTGNPYIAGSPLRDSYGFFGRQDILDWVLAELLNTNTNALVLYGQRRVGKTTILLQLKNYLPKEKFFPIYFDLQDQAKRPLGEVLADLVSSLEDRINLPKYQSDDFDDKGEFFRSVFIPDLYKTLDAGCRPVFLFDEFDVFDQVDEGFLDITAASKELFPFLRQVINDDSRTAFVFVVGRQPEDLKANIHQIFKTSLSKEIWVLDQVSAEKLIRQSEINETLKFTQEAINRILQLTSSHAYLTQLLCQRLWQQAYQNKPPVIPTIDIEEVNSAVPDALNAGEQAFTWIWEGLGPAEKIYATALAKISNENEPITEDQVIQVLAEHAARLRLREVEQAPQDLVKRHVLVFSENRKYIFAVEMFRRWIKQKRSLREVVDEIDNLDPIAQKLFLVGQDFYNKHIWIDAKRFFEEALQHNSNHFRANLLLGETLLSAGELEEAVHQLEIAYTLDKYESKLPFARGLILLARAKDKEGLDEDALKACEKALEISPNEREAKEIMVKVLNRQGDEKLKQGNPDEALVAFEKAGNKERVERITLDIKIQNLSKLEKDAETFFKQMMWKKASSLYKELIEKAPDEVSKEKWESALLLCEKEEKIEGLFTLGLGLLTSGDYDQAKTALKEVIHLRPEYVKDGKTAIKLLEQAVAKRRFYTPSWSIGLIFAAVLIIIVFISLSPSSPLFPLLVPSTPTSQMTVLTPINTITPDAITATPSPRGIVSPTEILTFTPISVVSPAPKSSYTPVLTFDKNTTLSGECWTADTNQINGLSSLEGFTRRDDGNWRYKIDNGRTTDEFVQIDFSQCLGNKNIGAIALNAWVLKLESEWTLPEAGKEFGIFIENANGQRREYTVWVDQDKSMHLRVRENNIITNDSIILIVNPNNLKFTDAFPRIYSEFPIQFFLEINNQGLDILYLREGSSQLTVRAEDINPNNMVLMGNSVRPTLTNVYKIGLIGYGGETQALLLPVTFMEGSTEIISLPAPTTLPTLRPTQTTAPNSTEQTLGNGYINKAVVSVWKDPNRNKITTLGLNQPVVLLELKFVSGSNWYRCRWDDNGIITEGWILAEYITLTP